MPSSNVLNPGDIKVNHNQVGVQGQCPGGRVQIGQNQGGCESLVLRYNKNTQQSKIYQYSEDYQYIQYKLYVFDNVWDIDKVIWNSSIS